MEKKKLLFIGKITVSVAPLLCIGNRSSGKLKLSDTKKLKIKTSSNGKRQGEVS